MEYYKPVTLECSPLIKKRTKEAMDQFKLVPFRKELVYSKAMKFTEEDRKIINDEVTSKGLSKIKDVLAFKRWGNTKYDKTSSHIDGNNNVIYNSSIVIPVSGCKDTEQYWLDGEYEIKKEVGASGITYLVPVWKSEPTLVDHVFINDQPMLCRVDIPHNAYGNGRQFRLTCTLRFENNESFEEIYEKLSRTS